MTQTANKQAKQTSPTTFFVAGASISDCEKLFKGRLVKAGKRYGGCLVTVKPTN